MVSCTRPSTRRTPHPPIRSVIAGCCLLVASFAASAAGEALSLDDVRRAARAEAPRVAASAARITAAREDAARAGTLPDPTLNLGIDNLTVTGADAFQLGADEMTMRRIGVMQDWPSRRKRDAQRAAADAQIDTALSEADAMALEVERLAGEAWIELWAVTTERDVLEALREEADRAVDIAQARLANGTGTTPDALAAQVTLAELDNERQRIDGQEREAQAGLSRWIDTQGDLVLAPPPDFTSLRTPSPQLRATLDEHAHLQVWAGKERAADRAVDLARSGKRPDLGFGVSYGARSAGLPDMMMLEVRVGLPLFPRDRQNRDVAARIAERDAVAADREDARREQREGLERQLARWESLRDELSRYESILLPLARDRSAVALAAYGSGGDLQPWIEARRDELETRRRHLQLQADLGRAWLALDTLLPRDTATTEIPR
jgi:cobalt-zinc-cadmium efflux system outer membrane protein